QGSGAGRSKSVKRVNDAPDRPEQPDKRSDRARSGQPGQASFQARKLLRGSDLCGALDGGDALSAAKFLETVLKDRDQRAGLELVRAGNNIRHSGGLGEGGEEASAGGGAPAQRSPLEKNDGPGKHAKK